MNRWLQRRQKAKHRAAQEALEKQRSDTLKRLTITTPLIEYLVGDVVEIRRGLPRGDWKLAIVTFLPNPQPYYVSVTYVTPGGKPETLGIWDPRDIRRHQP